MRRAFLGLAIVLLANGPRAGSAIEDRGRLEVRGSLYRPDQISAIAAVGPLLVVGADEGTAIQVLHPVSDSDARRADASVIPLLESETEIDIEGLCASGNTVYVLGSHSLKRRRLSAERSRSANRRRMREVVAEASRDHLFRFEMDASTGTPSTRIESVNLRGILERDPILGRFTRIPSKENGVDIEGIAVAGERLYLGFRSPVLRHNLVPVMVLPFARPAGYELRFVDLGGRGIRDLTRVRGGFLLIAGPSGDADGAFDLLLWDGEDRLPGTDSPRHGLVSFGAIPAADGARPEGIVLEEETERAWVVLVVYEGREDGGLTRLRIDKGPPPVSAGP